MSVQLYGRSDKRKLLKFVGAHPDYRTAVVIGRKDFGHRNFMVEKKHGYAAPSREEQLLQPKWNPNNLEQNGI